MRNKMSNIVDGANQLKKQKFLRHLHFYSIEYVMSYILVCMIEKNIFAYDLLIDNDNRNQETQCFLSQIIKM